MLKLIKKSTNSNIFALEWDGTLNSLEAVYQVLQLCDWEEFKFDFISSEWSFGNDYKLWEFDKRGFYAFEADDESMISEITYYHDLKALKKDYNVL